MNLQRLRDTLKKHEGLRLTWYKDTVGVPTIGYGRNLQVGISQDEAEMLLDNDIRSAYTLARTLVKSWEILSDRRREVVVNMAFNLGSRLLKFKMFLGALNEGHYNEAADEMLESKWAGQVGLRAQELSDWMREGG